MLYRRTRDGHDQIMIEFCSTIFYSISLDHGCPAIRSWSSSASMIWSICSIINTARSCLTIMKYITRASWILTNQSTHLSDCCKKYLSRCLVTLDWNGINLLTAWDWNVADGMEWRNSISGMVRNGMAERILESGNVVYIDSFSVCNLGITMKWSEICILTLMVLCFLFIFFNCVILWTYKVNGDGEILLRFLGGGDEITSLAFNSLYPLGCFVHLVLLLWHGVFPST